MAAPKVKAQAIGAIVPGIMPDGTEGRLLPDRITYRPGQVQHQKEYPPVLTRRGVRDKRYLVPYQDCKAVKFKSRMEAVRKREDKIYRFPFLAERDMEEALLLKVEDKDGKLCGLCGEWKKHKQFSAHVMKDKYHISEHVPICIKCFANSKMLKTAEMEERQQDAVDTNQSIAKEKDLSKMYYSPRLQRPIRFDAHDHLYIMCKLCLVWKPRSTYFFGKHSLDPRDMFVLSAYCFRCAKMAGAITSERLDTQKVNTPIKRVVNEGACTDQHVYGLFRNYPNDEKRRDLLGLYFAKMHAYKIMRRLALKHDEVFRMRGYTRMFSVEKQRIRARANVKGTWSKDMGYIPKTT